MTVDGLFVLVTGQQRHVPFLLTRFSPRLVLIGVCVCVCVCGHGQERACTGFP